MIEGEAVLLRQAGFFTRPVLLLTKAGWQAGWQG
jgi:hypothetical protein